MVESGKSILSIDNGYIILASLSQSSANGPSDIWLSEYIESTLNVGDTTWTQTWDINTFDVPERLIKKTDGSYALSGYSLNSGGEIESSWIINSDNSFVIPDLSAADCEYLDICFVISSMFLR